MSPDRAERICRQLYQQVGAIFTNTARTRDRCQVCTAPAVGLCGQCARQRDEYDAELADLVMPLAYVRGWTDPPHQSFHHMRRYKDPRWPSRRCQDDLKLMVLGATLLHGDCVRRRLGSRWDTLTFVPSVARQGVDHPVVALARSVADHSSLRRIVMDVGPGIDREPVRSPMVTRFAVSDRDRHAVDGRHVLVVDDTWVSGSKAQSAALALRAAGARTVTVLCVGRWLSGQWPEHRPLIEELQRRSPPYDPRLCPVTGATCPP